MMQSSPFNFRRAVMWIGRLILGPIFMYAGYSKAFLPNNHFWPWFFFKFSLSTNIANFAFQVDAFKLLSPTGVQFVAHTLPYGNCPRLPRANRLAASDFWDHAGGDHGRVFGSRDASLSAAHEHQLRMLRNAAADRYAKSFGRYRNGDSCSDDGRVRDH